jgi:hypothetical protein
MKHLLAPRFKPPTFWTLSGHATNCATSPPSKDIYLYWKIISSNYLLSIHISLDQFIAELFKHVGKLFEELNHLKVILPSTLTFLWTIQCSLIL